MKIEFAHRNMRTEWIRLQSHFVLLFIGLFDTFESVGRLTATFFNILISTYGIRSQ